jgi:hypothetical protein
MKICVFCMKDVSEEKGVCCGTYKGVEQKPELGEVIENYSYGNAGGTNINIHFACEWDEYGESEPCGAINLGVDVWMERGDRTAYSDPSILYGSYKCAECEHVYDYRVDIVK